MYKCGYMARNGTSHNIAHTLYSIIQFNKVIMPIFSEDKEFVIQIRSENAIKTSCYGLKPPFRLALFSWI